MKISVTLNCGPNDPWGAGAGVLVQKTRPTIWEAASTPSVTLQCSISVAVAGPALIARLQMGRV